MSVSAIIQVANLHYAYPPLDPAGDALWVLRGIDFAVEQGEFVSIMGATGSGKTTLCLALNGIVPQSTGGTIKGQVLVAGLDTKRVPVPKLARRVGIVFQEPETQFFNMSVQAEVAFGLETLGIPPAEMRERIDWALARVGMRGFQARSPFHLSGGQKQRVAIAAMLAMLPQVLVLDEPTTSLDPLGKAEIFNVVQTLRQQRNMTIVMTEHDSELVAEFSDRVLVLHEGRVELAGEPGEILTRGERMREIGLAVPQVSELAECLNRRHGQSYHFTRFAPAREILRASLGSTS